MIEITHLTPAKEICILIGMLLARMPAPTFPLRQSASTETHSPASRCRRGLESCRGQGDRRTAGPKKAGLTPHGDGVSWSLQQYAQGSFLVAGYRRPDVR